MYSTQFKKVFPNGSGVRSSSVPFTTRNSHLLRDAVNIHVATTNVKLTLEGGRGSELSFFDVSPWQYEFFSFDNLFNFFA